MSLPDTMSGAVLTRHGGPEALEWRTDLPVPRPGPGEVLVRVLAAGVNNTDIATREGWYAREATGGAGGAGGGWAGAIAFPRIQGGDLCGRVVAVGPGVGTVAEGARVTAPINLPRPTAENPVGFVSLGSEIDGAFAGYCRMRADDLHDVTDAPLSDVEIGAMPCAYGTAETLLERAGVAAGQRVLVTGASGGVGLAAVQLAALRGARVTAVAAAEKTAAVRQAGAEAVIGRDATPAPGGFDAVIDLVGGPGWAAVLAALRSGGHYAVAGAIAGPRVEADLRDIYLRDLTLHGCTFQPPATFRRLVARINAGEVRPHVSATYPMRDIARAQADFVAKRHAGKLVLIPEPEAA